MIPIANQPELFSIQASSLPSCALTTEDMALTLFSSFSTTFVSVICALFMVPTSNVAPHWEKTYAAKPGISVLPFGINSFHIRHVDHFCTVRVRLATDDELPKNPFIDAQQNAYG